MNLTALHTVVDRLCDIVDQLGSSFPPPVIVRNGDGFVDRHEPGVRSNGLVCYLKAVKACSTLNAMLVLLDKAYVQEAYALSRISQEQIEDVHFLVVPRIDNQELTDLQGQMIREFLAEEFDPVDPVGTSRDRNLVSRKKVRATVTNDMLDPSSGNAMSKMIYRMFSGYVHGVYGHVMELHSDSPGRYEMHGTPRHMADAVEYAPNFVYQAILAVRVLIDRSSRDDLMPTITALQAEVAATCDVLPPEKGKR
jgi:hypothetical protein